MKKIRITKSKGNVFEDLGFSNAQEALAKAELARLIHRIIRRKRYTQEKAANIMGVDQPKVSAIIRGQLSGFSIDRLFRFLLALGSDIEIKVKKHLVRSRPPSIQVKGERELASV